MMMMRLIHATPSHVTQSPLLSAFWAQLKMELFASSYESIQ